MGEMNRGGTQHLGHKTTSIVEMYCQVILRAALYFPQLFYLFLREKSLRKFEEISILLKYSIFLKVSQFFFNESQSKNFPVIEIKTAPRVNLDSIFVKISRSHPWL